MNTSWSEPWILSAALATTTCLLIFLYALLRIRHRRICQNLKSATESFVKQTKELEELKKKQNELADDFSSETKQSIIVAFDNKGVISYVNDYALEFFGFKKEELIGSQVLGTIAPMPRPSSRAPSLTEKILLNPHFLE